MISNKKYLSFHKSLPAEIYKKRHEIAIRKILEGEYSTRDLNKIYGYTPPARIESQVPGTDIKLSGQIITAAVAAALAPLLLSSFGKDKISTAVKLLSMPIAALGGATLYSLIHKETPLEKNKDNFEQAYPIGPEKGLLRL